ncbi:autophagy-related protein 9A-like [Tubulanus polymorphus]|uniref:autophagy-related protein 9A-like n=1 Tax=Tubulanus polymorphus TaxID=672921 RepID=UPI003DA48FF9
MASTSGFETGYQPLSSYYDDDTETPQYENIIHIVPDNKTRWNHIENLDEFFARVYQFHQRHGFLCMVIEDLLQLLQFVFVVVFSVYLIECVDYNVLFANVIFNSTHKVTIPETVIPFNQCVRGFNPMIVICLLIALVFWILRVIKVIYNIFKYCEIRAFYLYALKISAADLSNMTWHEVQYRLLEVQKEQQMCIHKQELSGLDIYHRILRFKNYMIAMVNKSVLPFKFDLPFIGEYTFLSQGLKYNLEMILFWGPWSPFQNYWHLKDDFKNIHKRKELAEQLSKHILWVGIANFIFCPIIFLWTILYSFFQYAELIKRSPSSLGMRRWSHYSRLYLRHFNELDHEFNARLSRGYQPATRFMNIFISPLLVVFAKNVVFFAGSVLAILIILTVIDEDVLAVSHMLTTMTILGVVVTISRSLIPDEHMIFCPEALLMTTLAQIHYMPDSWKGNAHTYRVRDEFSQLFQYKITCILEELLSPLITPFILCFSLRHRTLDVIDFFRNFTVEVVGVGDVCSFAQMDVRKHGNRQWVDEDLTNANHYQQAENGKTELSLMHFTLTNPEWKPPQDCSLFIHNVKQQAQRDASNTLGPLQENALFNSINTLSSNGPGYSSMMSSIVNPSLLRMNVPGSEVPVNQRSQYPLRGAISNTEGPITGTDNGLVTSIHSNHHLDLSPIGGGQTPSLVGLTTSCISPRQNYEEGTLELMSAEMSLSALYLHEIHHQRVVQSSYHEVEDQRARLLWQQHQQQHQQHQSAGPAVVALPSIGEEDDTRLLGDSYHSYHSDDSSSDNEAPPSSFPTPPPRPLSPQDIELQPINQTSATGYRRS